MDSSAVRVCLWISDVHSVADGAGGQELKMLSFCDPRQARMFPEYAPYSMPHHPRPRMDPTSDVFTCLFGDLFVKW